MPYVFIRLDCLFETSVYIPYSNKIVLVAGPISKCRFYFCCLVYGNLKCKWNSSLTVELSLRIKKYKKIPKPGNTLLRFSYQCCLTALHILNINVNVCSTCKSKIRWALSAEAADTCQAARLSVLGIRSLQVRPHRHRVSFLLPCLLSPLAPPPLPPAFFILQVVWTRQEPTREVLGKQ